MNRPRISADEIDRGRFNFLNRTKDFGSDIIWESADKDRLWRYNLHYFDYLLAESTLDRRKAVALMQSWVASNPPGAQDAWDTFPIALRIVNWIKYFSTADIDESWSDEIIGSTFDQALWMENNLEYHLLANHLFKNAKALFFSGLFFKGSDADRWLYKGIRILEEQIEEQVLPDGGHFERSPMYHAMILEDCLDLLNITHNCSQCGIINLKKKLEGATDRMVRYLDGICHPDGQIVLFNDAALGIEHTPGDLFQYYRRVTGKEVSEQNGRFWSFLDTGYFIMAPNSGDRIIIDCGPVGPDYQPGHSHCDTLSFELSLYGRRVFVDSGCFQYEDGEIRRYNRGNVGHNTVTIDSENQSEVWGAHRCARRAYPLYARLKEKDDGSICFEGAHDGYKRLKGKPIHHRSITWVGRQIAIEDRIEGQGTHDMESRLHINPDLKVETTDKGFQVGDKDQILMSVKPAGQGRLEIKKGWYCPEFGLKFECPVLSLKMNRIDLPVKFGWQLQVNKT